MDYRKNPEMPEQIQQKIIINDLLLECIAILRRSGDDEVAFNKLLGLVASFYGADRSYVFEFDLGSQKLSNTYEWCAEGIEAEIDKLQNLDIAIVDRWIVQFEDHGEFYINSTDGELDHDSDEYKILAMQGIESLMARTSGLGALNVHLRIQRRFGEEYGVHYTKTDTGNTCAVLTLPMQYNETA